jgi:pimeloyl-ACP methyl ester carboxylesterase
MLPLIDVPVLAIQGRDDEYGTLAQLESIHRALPASEVLVLDECGHSPHRDQPTSVLSAVRRFIGRTALPTPPP